MKAVLYYAFDNSVNHSGGWRVSLDPTLETDKLYWEQCGHSVQLYPWPGGELPYGSALIELEHLQGTGAPMGVAPLLSIAGGVDRRIIGWAESFAAAMPGRSLLWEEIVSLLEYCAGRESSEFWRQVTQYAYLMGIVELRCSVALVSRTSWWGLRRIERWVCQRCGASGESLKWTSCASCGEECAYCESCLTMGRTRQCAPLVTARRSLERRAVSQSVKHVGTLMVDDCNEVADATFGELCMRLPDLHLSPAQAAAAEAGVRHVQEAWRLNEIFRRDEYAGEEQEWEHGQEGRRGLDIGGRRGRHSEGQRDFLIWAVTGAGKTEMMYPLVAASRLHVGKVLIATPRKDVVLELLPRVREAFKEERVKALYGGSSERWESADIIVATTHQLMRYWAAFDLVVLDEVDAYPYHNNPMLTYAARKACKPGGAFVMLSATPPNELRHAVKSGRLPHVKVPVRYHRHPLPVPRLARPSKLALLLQQSLARGAQAFVFVSRIARLEPELRRLRQLLSAYVDPCCIDATSSKDPDRADKVLGLRSGNIRILLTTTILERGVTIAKADVYVLDADSRLFDASALVQMAGRAGRSAKDPHGVVRFLTKERTRAISSAVRQIRSMNRLARRQGYLIRGQENGAHE